MKRRRQYEQRFGIAHPIVQGSIGSFGGMRFLLALLSIAIALPAEDLPASTPTARSHINPYQQRFGRARPIIAVIGENAFTELTDYFIPYGVLTESGAAHVLAVATQPGPIQMFPALRIQPQTTIVEFDAHFPQGADYVIVPAVHRSGDPVLLRWVSQQAIKGATIIGVCDGVWVLANAGLLKGRKAVGHWYSFAKLQKKFPDTQWVRNTRYLADGNVVTTTGVTASVPVSLALVEAIAGTDRAREIARSLGAKDWSAVHRSDHFKLNATQVLTAASNWLSVWSRHHLGAALSDGVDEMALAFVADAYSRTYNSTVYSVAPSQKTIRTRRGLDIVPDRTALTGLKGLSPFAEIPPVSALDEALRSIGVSMGPRTASFVALQMEYPRP